MTDYKATPEQWEVQEKFAPESEDACCLLELRSRVERLELGAGIYDSVIKTLTSPNLKEQALGAIGRFTTNAHTNGDEMMRDFDTIRRALEQLDD